ncbi:sigma-70 family RNA polymerase sigma factor [Acuticoccus sp. M5D2P5]|uniref:sigma-70 family RNA polymerase sigma factor n=1 Tax=Acuticoccus kalidii TaxID=2910977 RepID=UPI001F335FB4|nr:sigma-70 family RNA polymerase sigma factor [Acuticoccus kalidii]MCF3935399.1 sigma-70 family RNA polymerase sigma factor [Acuticoccus kalidii]
MSTDGKATIEDLIARTALGDRNAFGRLYDATAAKLLAVCLRVLKNRDEAEDALQEVFVKIWNNADRYQVNGHSPMTWLITIARNAAIDRLRARRTHDDLADVHHRLVAPGADPEHTAVATSEAARMTVCLHELEENRRKAVTGAYFDGKTYQELADTFEIPLNTMRTWLRRSLAKLKECMSR